MNSDDIPAVKGGGAAVAAGISVDGGRSRAPAHRGGRRHRDQVLVVGHLKRNGYPFSRSTYGAFLVRNDVRSEEDALLLKASEGERSVGGRHKVQYTTAFHYHGIRPKRHFDRAKLPVARLKALGGENLMNIESDIFTLPSLSYCRSELETDA